MTEESSPGIGHRLRNSGGRLSSDSFVEPSEDGVGSPSFGHDVVQSMSRPARAEVQRRVNDRVESEFGTVSETNVATVHPSAMPHTSSSPETSSPVHCSGSFPNAAAQHEPDRKQSHIPKVVLVEEGREDNEGILLLKGGLVTPPSKDDSSSSLLPKRTSKIAVSMLQAESSVVEDECTEGDSYDTTKAKMDQTTYAPPVSSSLLQPSRAPKVSPLSMMSSAKKWKNRTMAQKMIANLTIAKDARHQEILDRQVIRACTEIPRSFLIDVLEEALPIVQKTAQIYKRELGSQDPLTVQAAEHLEKLKQRLR